jgi:hypothetical protein
MRPLATPASPKAHEGLHEVVILGSITRYNRRTYMSERQRSEKTCHAEQTFNYYII